MARSVDFGFGRALNIRVNGSSAARELTQGALYAVMSGGLMENPVLQILSEPWKIRAGCQFERCCILVSDGQHKEVATLSSELHDNMTPGAVPLYSVVQINRFRTHGFNDVQGRERSTMVIKRLTILKYGTEVGNAIGNPVFLSERGAALNTARQLRAIARHLRLLCIRLRRAVQREGVPAGHRQIQNVPEGLARIREVLLEHRRGRLAARHVMEEHGVVLLPPDVNQALEQLVAQFSVAPPA